jgi:hypothetical protein
MSCLVREMFCFQDVGNSNILCSCELDNFRHSVELFRVNTGHLTFFFSPLGTVCLYGRTLGCSGNVNSIYKKAKML